MHLHAEPHSDKKWKSYHFCWGRRVACHLAADVSDESEKFGAQDFAFCSWNCILWTDFVVNFFLMHSLFDCFRSRLARRNKRRYQSSEPARARWRVQMSPSQRQRTLSRLRYCIHFTQKAVKKEKSINASEGNRRFVFVTPLVHC